MRSHFTIFATTAAFGCLTCVAAAHHSIAMFDQKHPIELVGTVQEFRFASPHAYIFLQVQAENAPPVTWILEGHSPNSLTWDGWSSKTLRPGDQLTVTIDPLRSGEPGGAWIPGKVKFRDGTPVVANH